MTSTATHIRVQDLNGIKRIEFVERNILDEANIQQIGEEISRVVDEQEVPRVVISFLNVDHLSSAALGTLIAEVVWSPHGPLGEDDHMLPVRP